MRPVGFMEIKQALHDPRFQDLFPEMRYEIDKYLKKPTCGTCAIPIAQKILNDFPDRVSKYFPDRAIVRPADEATQLGENHWLVINCHVNELEGKLRALPTGRKQIAIARHEDQVTVIVNELAVVF